MKKSQVWETQPNFVKVGSNLDKRIKWNWKFIARQRKTEIHLENSGKKSHILKKSHLKKHVMYMNTCMAIVYQKDINYIKISGVTCYSWSALQWKLMFPAKSFVLLPIRTEISSKLPISWKKRKRRAFRRRKNWKRPSNFQSRWLLYQSMLVFKNLMVVVACMYTLFVCIRLNPNLQGMR